MVGIDPQHSNISLTDLVSFQHSNISPDRTMMNLSMNQDRQDLRHAILVSYLATLYLGITGNGLVIYIIAYNKHIRMKSVANYYIWNLSFADLFFTLTLVFFCYGTFTENWPFGSFVCKLSLSIRETNRFASVFTLMALSIDRYLASYHTLSHLRTVNVGKIVCFVIWILCLAISIPYWLFAVAVPKGSQGYRCTFEWPSERTSNYRTLWTYFKFIFGLLLPIVVIFISYLFLALRLRRMLKASNAASRIHQPSRKMTRTILVVVLTFLFCQTPCHVVDFINLMKIQRSFDMKQRGMIYTPSKFELNTFIYLNAVAQILGFVSSCCNPIIYGLLNENYRKLYRGVFCKCFPSRYRPETRSGPSEDGKSGTGVLLQYRCPCGSQTNERIRPDTPPLAPSTQQFELEERIIRLMGNDKTDR